jgi:hypothetical protein
MSSSLNQTDKEETLFNQIYNLVVPEPKSEENSSYLFQSSQVGTEKTLPELK